MKTTRNLLLAGIMAAFCGSIGNAQISYSNSLVGATLIYSNAFGGSGSVNITNTTPDFFTNALGGSNNAAWIDVGASGDNGGLFADGTVTTVNQGDTWLLPFTPQSGYVYTLSVSVNITANPGSWITAGYAQHYAHYAISSAPPNSSINSYAWTLRNFSGNTEYFAGPAGNHNVYNSTPAGPTGIGTYTYKQILDTTGPQWITTAFFNDVPLGTPYNYGAAVPIAAIGVGQHSLGAPSAYQWTSLTLSAAPLVITEQPVSAGVAAGSAFTNTVVVAATAPSYQWFTNSVPIAGATNASLILNPVTVANACTNYYVVITNSLGGSATSAPVSLTVYTAPAILAASPVAYTNLITLYGGTNVDGTNYPGSTPTFSVSVIGQAPFSYWWLTNGVAAGGSATFTGAIGTTKATFTFTNCLLNGPTNFTFVATNSQGATTNTWAVSYIQAPMVPFPKTILSYNPIGFWRLNDGPDDGSGDDGVVASDYASGNNGLYTNAVLGYAGYTNTDPTDASARFGYYDFHSDVFGIQGIDFSNSPNATFTVQAWVNGAASQPNGACIIAKGYNGGEQFALDVNGNKWRFLVRNAAGTASSVTASTGPDGSWHFVVGVCDEVNGSVSLYVDGQTVGSAPIASGSGVFPCATPITIGARGSSPTDNDSLQFFDYISDVAAYSYALTSGQVAELWIAAGFSVGFTFVPPLPPTNYVFQANGTITIPATVFGPAPLGYYWTNVTTGGIVGAGSTNIFGNLDATLIISNAPASLSGDQLELVVTNATDSTNWLVTLFSPPPPVTLDYSNPILYSNYFNGGLWSVCGMPLTAANALVGGTNATWVDALGTNDTGRLQANGTPTTTQGDTWLLPFTPHSGYVYTLTASVTLAAYPGSWVGVGFAQTLPINATPNCAINNGAVNGYAWQIDTAGGTQNLQAFKGPAGSTQVLTINGAYPALPTTITNTIVLDTTGSSWTATFYVNGVLEGSTSYATTPPIGAVCITQNAVAAPQNIQWNSFSLTQVAPSGAAPYLLDPQPPTSVTLGAGASLSISASAFGSIPLGYQWSNTNTAAILGSGGTNNIAPLIANLSVASVPDSWNGNTLALVVTNAYGTNISLVLLTVTNSFIIPTNQPTVTGFSLVGGNVMISATNGQSGATYYLLGSTNLTTPLSQWLPVATNVIVTNGSVANGFTFTGTNVIQVSNPQQFYILSNTN